MGRSGRLFAFEWSDIEPDMIAVAKGIGGGFPIGACLAKAHVATAFKPGSHGTTYGGNPMAMAVGNAVLDEILKPGFLDSVVTNSQVLRRGLEELKARHGDLITDVRGVGLMIGVELATPARPFLEALIEAGMLAAAAGNKVIRLLPPLIITQTEIKEALEKLDRVLKAVSKN